VRNEVERKIKRRDTEQNPDWKSPYETEMPNPRRTGVHIDTMPLVCQRESGGESECESRAHHLRLGVGDGFARFGNDHIHEFLPPIKEEMVDFL
jgi:hypothetical protein